jgi:hypothetical protein
MVRGLIFAALALTTLSVAQAAELDGVAMPDTWSADGTEMRLNGIGLRTFSFLGIPIYVAGLYLERPSGDSDTILRSRDTKLLSIRFLRDVDAEHGRRAWQDGFEQNCKRPCALDPAGVERFLSRVPEVHKGDETTLLFTSKGVDITFDGRPMGTIADPHFAEVMLATFIGPAPATPRLKRELLGDGR